MYGLIKIQNIIISRIRFIMEEGFYPGEEGLNKDIFFCLFTGIWAYNWGLGGVGLLSGGLIGSSLPYFISK